MRLQADFGEVKWVLENLGDHSCNLKGHVAVRHYAHFKTGTHAAICDILQCLDSAGLEGLELHRIIGNVHVLWVIGTVRGIRLKVRSEEGRKRAARTS